jgi:hypothetical protein
MKVDVLCISYFFSITFLRLLKWKSNVFENGAVINLYKRLYINRRGGGGEEVEELYTQQHSRFKKSTISSYVYFSLQNHLRQRVKKCRKRGRENKNKRLSKTTIFLERRKLGRLKLNNNLKSFVFPFFLAVFPNHKYSHYSYGHVKNMFIFMILIDEKMDGIR